MKLIHCTLEGAEILDKTFSQETLRLITTLVYMCTYTPVVFIHLKAHTQLFTQCRNFCTNQDWSGFQESTLIHTDLDTGSRVESCSINSWVILHFSMDLIDTASTCRGLSPSSSSGVCFCESFWYILVLMRPALTAFGQLIKGTTISLLAIFGSGNQNVDCTLVWIYCKYRLCFYQMNGCEPLQH